MTKEEKVQVLSGCIREARSIEELADMLTERGLEVKRGDDKVTQALECCGDNQRCCDCPYTEESECYTKMSRDAHDIVVRQREEIARLTKLCELRDRDNKDTTELLIEAEEQIKKLKIAMQILSTQKKRP